MVRYKICQHCFSYLITHPDLLNWLKCPNCDYRAKQEPEMIKMTELNPKNHELTTEQHDNLVILHEKINKIRNLWGKPMVVTSGFRSKEDHLRVYRNIANKRDQKFDETKVPMGSMHLKGAACDISDPDGSLFQWCKDNVDKLEEVGLWCEEKDDQARVHFQIYPPKSGKRFFYP